MDLRRLPGSPRDRRYGRRATDAGSPARFYCAAFLAQVAGLAAPAECAAYAYEAEPPRPPNGLVADRKV